MMVFELINLFSLVLILEKLILRLHGDQKIENSKRIAYYCGS